MKHQIDPTVDCVFKAVLGSESNKNLLIHFLNAVLALPAGQHIQEVELLNPFNEREFASDKLSVVDVKAKDEQRRSYQIEIQKLTHADLPARMLYTWCSLYHALLNKGDDFAVLKPVLAIWLLCENLFPALPEAHLAFAVLDPRYRVRLTDHLGIHVLQLPAWQCHVQPDEFDRWMYFFKEGKMLDIEHPPTILQTQEMTQAMSTLQRFSENERHYLLYQQRLEAEFVEATWKNQVARAERKAEQEQQEKERERAEKERAYAEKERERAEKERAYAEKERLLALLQQLGIDPNQ